MEDFFIVLLVMTLYLPTFVGVMWVLKRPNTGKKKVQESSSDSVREMFDTSSRGYKDIVKVKDNQIRSLTAKLNLANDETQQSEEPGLLDTVPEWEDIKALAKTQGINPLLLEVPFIKKEVKKLISGMTIQEITKNVGEIKTLASKYGFKLGNPTDDKPEDLVADLLKQNPEAFH